VTPIEAIKRLEDHLGRLRALHAQVDKKRWRPSEKTMTKARFAQDIEAMEYAISCAKIWCGVGIVTTSGQKAPDQGEGVA
jgi:hypothetical protein